MTSKKLCAHALVFKACRHGRSAQDGYRTRFIELDGGMLGSGSGPIYSFAHHEKPCASPGATLYETAECTRACCEGVHTFSTLDPERPCAVCGVLASTLEVERLEREKDLRDRDEAEAAAMRRYSGELFEEIGGAFKRYGLEPVDGLIAALVEIVESRGIDY